MWLDCLNFSYSADGLFWNVFTLTLCRADFLFCYKVTVSTMCERTDLDVWKSFADIVVTVCLKSKVTSNSLNLDSYYVFWWFIDPSFWPLINLWNLFILSAFLMYRVEFKRITALSTNVRSSRERLAMQSRQNKQNHSSVLCFSDCLSALDISFLVWLHTHAKTKTHCELLYSRKDKNIPACIKCDLCNPWKTWNSVSAKHLETLLCCLILISSGKS